MMKAWFITTIVCFLIQLNSGMCELGDKEHGNEESVFSSGSVFRKHESVTLPQDSEDSVETARSWSPFSFISPRRQARMVSVSTFFCGVLTFMGLFLVDQAVGGRSVTYFCDPGIPDNCDNCTLESRAQEILNVFKLGNTNEENAKLWHRLCILQRSG